METEDPHHKVVDADVQEVPHNKPLSAERVGNLYEMESCGSAEPSPFMVNMANLVAKFYGVNEKEGDKFQKITEGQAICGICCNSLQESINVLKTKCSCESSLVHEQCIVQNQTCEYCKEIVQYIPVKLESLDGPTSLKRSLRLTDMEGSGVVIPDGLWSTDTEVNSLFLVGRLLSSKQPKFEALVSSITNLLNPVKGLEMRNLADGRFLIRFRHIIDRNRALDGCPWSFEKNTIVLSGIGVNENPLCVDLKWCEFSVHVHDLPLSKMNLGIVTLIGNKIGSGEETPYGPWLRAPVSPWGTNRKSSFANSHFQHRCNSKPIRGHAVFGDFGDLQGQAMPEIGKGKNVVLECQSRDNQAGEHQVDQVVCAMGQLFSQT
ncbi:hypothetical protein Sango_1026300 [Sesamum angolense]|uniref:DUF4283 domain-containing protein n=1 Tax=Sesamum angolense TaxID=2727404 RepID=A0AAE1X0H3_9LAMI|nr:hypothetical protein Sango_1026300 [Sesamum angolense]